MSDTKKPRVIWVVCKIKNGKPVTAFGEGSSVFGYIKKEHAEKIAEMAIKGDEKAVKFVEAK